MITVKELKEMLKNLNDDDFVILSSDEEGNEYRAFDHIDTGYWNVSCKEFEHEDDIREYLEEEDINDIDEYLEFDQNIKTCIILYP